MTLAHQAPTGTTVRRIAAGSASGIRSGTGCASGASEKQPRACRGSIQLAEHARKPSAQPSNHRNSTRSVVDEPDHDRDSGHGPRLAQGLCQLRVHAGRVSDQRGSIVTTRTTRGRTEHQYDWRYAALILHPYLFPAMPGPFRVSENPFVPTVTDNQPAPVPYNLSSMNFEDSRPGEHCLVGYCTAFRPEGGLR